VDSYCAVRARISADAIEGVEVELPPSCCCVGCCCAVPNEVGTAIAEELVEWEPVAADRNASWSWSWRAGGSEAGVGAAPAALPDHQGWMTF